MSRLPGPLVDKLLKLFITHRFTAAKIFALTRNKYVVTLLRSLKQKTKISHRHTHTHMASKSDSYDYSMTQS